MKIGIIGAGAMGSVYGAILGDAGNEIWLFDRWREHVEAVRASGLRCTGASGDRTVRVGATTDAADAGVCELAIIATKSMHTAPAVEAARSMIGPATIVLSLQNGLGNGERAAELCGPEHVLVGIAGGFAAEMRAPGHVHHNGWEAINLAELAGPISPRLEQTGELWRAAGFQVALFDDWRPLVWSKLMANIALSAVCTLTGQRVGQVRSNPHAWQVAHACVAEAAAVASAKGISLSYADPHLFVDAFAEKIPNGRPSMYQDVLAGRESEITTIHGGVVAEGAQLGIPTPVCSLMVDLVLALQEKRRQHGESYTPL